MTSNERFLTIRGATFAASAAGYIATRLIDKSATLDSDTVGGMVEWASTVAGSWSAISIIRRTIAQYVEHTEQEVKTSQEILPKFERTGKSVMKLAQAEAVRGQGLVTLGMLSLLEPLIGTEEASETPDERLWRRALKDTTNNMVEILRASNVPNPNTEEEEYRNQAIANVAGAAWMLDEVAPISGDDNLTVEYQTGEKHWFDFVWVAARLPVAA